MSSYRCVFIMGVERALEYRMSFFLSMLSAVFPILIQTTMWNYLYGHTDAASVFGYEQGQILLSRACVVLNRPLVFLVLLSSIFLGISVWEVMHVPCGLCT